MNKKLIVKQNSFKDCGPSCLLSVMRYYKIDVSHEELSLNLKMDREGTNAYNIINVSKLYGLDGYGIHYSSDEIISGKIKLPIIVHVLKNNYYHFIVIYEVNNSYLTVMDPSVDNVKLDIETFKKIYLNTCIILYPVKKVSIVNNNKRLIDVIKIYLKKENKIIYKIIIYSFIIVLLSLLLNTYTLILIDYLIPNYNSKLLITITLIFLLLGCYKSLLNYYKNKLVIYFNKKVSKYLNNEVINKFFNLPYLFFKNKSTSEVINRINDLEIFKEVFTSIVVSFSTNSILIIMSMIILLYINIKLFIINIISLLLYFIIVILFKNKFNLKLEQLLENKSIYNKFLNENIYSYEINRNINQIDNRVLILKNKYNNYISSESKYSCLLNKQIVIKDILFIFTNILSLSIGVIFVINNKITIGKLFLYISIVYYFVEPIKEILDLFPNINYLKNIYNRINDLLLIKEKEETKNKHKIKGNIMINNISYSYNNIDYVIKNITLKIPYKSKYLIYGKSGLGKSTIIKILLKYLNDYEGNIKIDNKDLNNISKLSIQDSFTYVSQNNYITNDTIKNNIIYDRDINENEYKKIIDICNLNTLIESKYLKDNFMIEDNGFNISGGEKQKIILARSLLKDSNYIILDESLSEVDINEEKQILNKIFDVYKEKTIIYISHKKEIISMFKQKYKIERIK